MPKPENYNNSGLVVDVDSDQLYVHGSVSIEASIQNVATYLKGINTAWEGLKISWVGTTQAEAEAFNHKWSSLMVRLFGPFDKSVEPAANEAVLGRMKVAVMLAAANYGNAEQAVVDMFALFKEGTPKTDFDSTRQPSGGPVVETNTPKTPGH